MQTFHYYSMAATCLFLAYKVEECVPKMRELVIACVRVAQKDLHKMVDEQKCMTCMIAPSTRHYEDRGHSLHTPHSTHSWRYFDPLRCDPMTSCVYKLSVQYLIANPLRVSCSIHSLAVKVPSLQISP
ncbi:hypothetical protein BDR22DRAFT_862072, partial [Usnea florida]